MDPLWYTLVLLWTSLLGVMSTDSLTFSVVEELQIGTFVGNIKNSADFATESINRLTFTIFHPDEDGFDAGQYFQVESSSGILTLSAVIDRDAISHCAYKNTCQLTFEIVVGPAEYFQVITVTVDVRDINDNSPEFSKTEYTLNISESAFPGTAYNLPSVTDKDGEDFGIQRFEVLQQDSLFNVTWSRDLQGRVLPKLMLRQTLDRESVHMFDLTVIAYDSGSPANSAELLVRINVQDMNDNDPEFTQSEYEAWIFENSPRGTSLITIHAEDPDSGTSGRVKYSLSSQNFNKRNTKFRINPDSGVIYLQEEVDREEESTYYLSVTATDQAKDQRQATTSVKIHVDDVNDNAPVIRINVITESGRAEVVESAQSGTFVALVSVSDKDYGPNSDVSCQLNSNRFAIQTMDSANKFKIITNSYLDREEREDYNLRVTCMDHGSPVQSSDKTVSIYITDINDHAPRFSQQVYRTEISENNHIGVALLQLDCVDEDAGDNADITFSLRDNTAGHFMIETKTGILRASNRFDYETLKATQVTVVARDAGSPPRSSSCVVEVQIQDVNDQPPEFAESDYTFIVRENQMNFSQIGSVSAFDKDSASNGRFWYVLSSDTDGGVDYFRISRDNGSISLTRPLDRELQPFYHMTVTATNYEPPELSATTSLTIYVQDVNDNTPIVDFPSSVNNSVHVSSRLPPGYKVTQIRAHDTDTGENADLSFFLAEETNTQQTFGVDPKSGEVFLNHDLSLAGSQVYHLRVLVKDNGVPELSTTANFTVVVNESLTVPLVPVGQRPDSLGQRDDRNMTIIIIVVAVSGVVIIVLLGAIVFVLLSSRRKRRRTPLRSTNVAMDNLQNNSNQGNLDPEGMLVSMTTEKKAVHDDEEEEKQRYVPLSVKPLYNNMNNSAAGDRRSPLPTCPRGVYVSSQAPGRYMSYKAPDLLAEDPPKAVSPCPSGPAPRPGPDIVGDRDSAASAEDASITDSGRGASEEGDHSAGDHGRPQSSSPPPIPPKSELLLTPNYGLKQLQTHFDPHYRIKYNNLDRPTPAHCDILTPGAPPNHANPFKHTVRTVKAKGKKVDPLSAAISNSSVMRRYKPDCSDPSSYYNPSLCAFPDSGSLSGYKPRPVSSCLSEVTDATSEASATSGTYILDHDDGSKPGVITASRC